MIEVLSGIGLVVSGSIFLFLWFRDRKYPAQKKIGFFFVFSGAILVVGHLMGWL